MSAFPGGRELLVHALQRVYTMTLRGADERFRRAVRVPEAAQQSRLKRHLKENANTVYGRYCDFDRITSVQAFQERVPVVDYDALEPWIRRIARGEQQVLSADPVRMLERSGGSTATNKLIPYTNGLLSDFSAATSPWLRDLFRSFPGLAGTRQYWSISPAAQTVEVTDGGLRIGFEDDTEYFGPLVRLAMNQLMTVPGSVARIGDMETWRRTTLLHLLEADDLGFVSVWNPSFLTLLMKSLEHDWDEYLRTVRPERALALQRRVQAEGRISGEAIWPRLQLISCWADGIAAEFLPALRAYFPRIPIQPKGLLATEGVVSFPLHASAEQGAVLAVAGHFLEFIDLEQPNRRPLLAHQLRTGGVYSPLLTTGNGFARYHLKDVLRCTGHHLGTPLVRFEGKLDRVSDLCGEKINARQVDEALAQARQRTGATLEFALLAPIHGEPPHYRLYCESSADDETLQSIAEQVETYLSTGVHYRYARSLGQLGSLQVARVANGWKTFEATLTNAGLKAGDIKPTHLDSRPLWNDAFRSTATEVRA